MATEGTTLLDAHPMRTIETERLQLTTLQMSDLDDLEPIYTDPEVMKWTSTGRISAGQQAERWLSSRALGPGMIQFAVRLRPDSTETASQGILIGILGSFDRPKCGYLFRTGYHGKGYATEALRAFIPVYFDNVPSPRTLPAPGDVGGDAAATSAATGAYDYLEAWTDTENDGSQRVLTKGGFRRGHAFDDNWEAPAMGLRSSVVFHLPRPGLTLEEVGIGEDGVLAPADGEHAEGLVPPIQ